MSSEQHWSDGGYNQMFQQCLLHYGRSKMDGAPGRGSGRYPLGSGDDPYQDYPSKHKAAMKERHNGDGGKMEGLADLAIRAVGNATIGAARRGIAAARYKNDTKRREANTNIDKASGFRKKDHEYSDKEDINAINPGYSGSGGMFSDKTASTNCGFCTTAYELRKRGYDVRALKATKDAPAFTNDVAKKKLWKPPAKNTEFDMSNGKSKYGLPNPTKIKERKEKVKEISDWASKQPDQRGNLCMHFNQGVGHSVAYEIKGGKLTVIDTQCKKSYEGEKYLSKLSGCSGGLFGQYGYSKYFYDFDFIRTDNCKPNWNEIKKYVE